MFNHIYLPYDRKRWIHTQVVPPILDVGCGPRGWIFSDTPFHPHVTYLDIDLRIMPNFIQGDAHSLPFRDNSFNTVCANEVLEHVIEPKQVLKEAVRVARLIVVFTIPSEHRWKPELKPFMKLEERLDEEGLDKLELYRRDNPDTLTTIAVETGQAWHKRHFTDKDIAELLDGYKYHVWISHHPGGWVFYSGVIYVC